MTHSHYKTSSAGFTLVELIVAVGLFALIMVLATGAYLVMIGVNREAQGITTGVNNLSFVLENMTRNIRTGTRYSCGSGGTSFDFVDQDNVPITYSWSSGGPIKQERGAEASLVNLTDPVVDITRLSFDCTGTAGGDNRQPHVTIIVSGQISVGPGKQPQKFYVETGATMRSLDL